MDSYFISIIIPVYQVEKYIERCIRSVMCQQGEISMECILVNDCSPDDSMVIAEQLIKDYSGKVQFKIVKHEKNSGLSVARNTGMRKATGKYLFFLDSDDYITSDCIQKLVDVVNEYPEVQVVKGNHEGRTQINMTRIPLGNIENDRLLELLYMGVIPVMAWNTLIKRTLVEQWNLSFKQGLVYEDNLWTVQLFRHTESFLFVPKVTYHYEENPDSILGEQNVILCQPKYLPHKILIVDELLNSYDLGHFVSYTCYVVSQLMLIFDCVAKDGHIDANICKHVHRLRNRLVKYTLRHGRFILVIYEMLLFMPFRMLMRYRGFRHNYYRIEIMFYKFAKSFNWLHS